MKRILLLTLVLLFASACGLTFEASTRPYPVNTGYQQAPFFRYDSYYYRYGHHYRHYRYHHYYRRTHP